MSLNYAEIDRVLLELDLAGAFVQEIVQPNFDSLALYTYKPGAAKTVFVCLASGATRIHETRRKITKNEKPLRFNELLKSKIKGARILSCNQIGRERIVRIELEKAGAVFVMPRAEEKFQKIQDARAKIQETDTDNEEKCERYTLFIRLWSNAANVFLCGEDGKIIDSFFRRPAKNEMSGEDFVLPEPGKSQKIFEAREFEEIGGENSEHPLSYSEKIDRFYSESLAKNSLESLLIQAEKWHESHRSRLESALENLNSKRDEFLNSGSLKHSGDLILVYPGEVSSAAGNFIEVDDWETGGKARIRIDAEKSAQENAQDYYERYKKAQSGLAALEHDIRLTEKSISELDRKYEQMVQEKNPIRLEQILRKTQTPKQLEKKAHPGLEYRIDGWTILVGRDAEENDDLLRHYARGSDLWLHARDYHGGYVFVKARAGKTVPLEILLYAGNLAVYYSKARKNGSADLYYTQVKHLRRAKNGPKGLVLPTNEKNLFIKLDESKLRELEEKQGE